MRLADKTILLAQTAEALCKQLTDNGARVISYPRSVLRDPDDYDLLDQAIANLYGYDWLLLSSAASVEHFLNRWWGAGYETHELDQVRVCASDAAAVARLADEHIHVDLAPASAHTATVWGELTNYLGDAEALACLNFLLPRAAGLPDALADKLTDVGARADVVPAYQTQPAGDHSRAKIAALLNGGGFDAVVFTAPQEVTEFGQLFDANDLRDLLADTPVWCANDATARAASVYGVQAQLYESANF